MNFTVSHRQKAQDDDDPVHIIRDDGTISSRILPAEDGVEDSPASASVEFWVTKLEEGVSDVERERKRGDGH